MENTIETKTEVETTKDIETKEEVVETKAPRVKVSREELIKRNIKRIPNIGRAETSILGKNAAMKKWGDKWDDDSISTLRAMIKGKHTMRCIARKLARSYVAVWAECKKLGLTAKERYVGTCDCLDASAYIDTVISAKISAAKDFTRGELTEAKEKFANYRDSHLESIRTKEGEREFRAAKRAEKRAARKATAEVSTPSAKAIPPSEEKEIPIE